MFAIIYSCRAAAILALAVASGAVSGRAGAEPSPPAVRPAQKETFAARAERLFFEARKAWKADTNHAGLACNFARASFEWADFATNNTQRADLARDAIRVARAAIEKDPASAAAHYYLALNLGQLARTKGLGALSIVDEMEKLLLRARDLDGSFQYAGADRCLGQLYMDAPGWPASIGNRSKAISHLTRAVELSPEFPDNHLRLLHAMLKFGRTRDLTQRLAAAAESMQKAAARFTGPEWEESLISWESRWQEINRQATPAKRTAPRARR